MNDAYARSGKDRNLYIQYVIVNGHTLQPQQGTYHGTVGSGGMLWGGTLSWNVANLFDATANVALALVKLTPPQADAAAVPPVLTPLPRVSPTTVKLGALVVGVRGEAP